MKYLEALHRSDQKIGKIPSDGAHAQIGKIISFLAFFRQTVCEEMQCEIDIVRDGFRKKGYVDRRDDGSWHVLALNSRIDKTM